jgi:sulfite reductase (NADPH) flavoprotein alpha-component
MNTRPGNLLLVAVAMVTWLVVCLLVWRRARAKQRATAALAAADSDSTRLPLLVAYASQTGMAENLAMQTASALQTAGVNVQLVSFAHLEAAALQSFEEVLLVVSTYGEGDPPDAAAEFIGAAMRSGVDLARVRYGVLVWNPTDEEARPDAPFGARLVEIGPPFCSDGKNPTNEAK